MQITYNDSGLKSDLERIVKETRLKAMLEYRASFGGTLEGVGKSSDGPAFGFAPPEGWVDLGKYAISFIFSEPIAHGVIASAIWETMKQSYALLRQKKNGSGQKREFAILTDQYGMNEARKTIYFVLKDNLEESAFEDAIKQIPRLREKITSLETSDITGMSDVVELNYVSPKWALSIFADYSVIGKVSEGSGPKSFIIANKNATNSEVDSLRGIAEYSGLGDISVQKTGGTTALGASGAPEVILVLKYAALVIGGGILNAIGGEIWEKVKKFVIETFKMYRGQSNSDSEWIYNPIVVVDIEGENGFELQIHFPRKDIEEVEKSIGQIQEILAGLKPNQKFVSLKYVDGQWVLGAEHFKSQEELRDEIFQNAEKESEYSENTNGLPEDRRPEAVSDNRAFGMEGIKNQIKELLGQLQELGVDISDTAPLEERKPNNLARIRILSKYKFGPIIVGMWLIISAFLTNGILNKITPDDVDLGTFLSCSEPTIDDCVRKEVQPRAAEKIEEDFINILQNIKRVGAAFPPLRFPMEAVEFGVVLAERGSELQFSISEPKYTETLLSDLDLGCEFADKDISLNSYEEKSIGEYLSLNNLDENKIKDIAKSIADKFGGCDWMPKENINLRSRGLPKEVAPNGIISVKKIIRVGLSFQTNWWGKLSIFFGLFAILGGIMLLIRQAIQLWKRGKDYFSE